MDGNQAVVATLSESLVMKIYVRKADGSKSERYENVKEIKETDDMVRITSAGSKSPVNVNRSDVREVVAYGFGQPA